MPLSDALILLIGVLSALIGFVLVLFVPSMWEIMKPKDKGPRRMKDATLMSLGVRVRRLKGNLVRLHGDLDLPNGFEFEENVIVHGCLRIGDRCHFSRSVKVAGDVIVGAGVVIDENLLCEGNLNVMDETVIGGFVDAGGDIRLGENVFVGGSVAAGGLIELFENCEVVGGVFPGKGAVKVRRLPRVEFTSDLEDVE